MISALNKLPDGTLELTITIPWKRINQAYGKTLAKITQKAEIKGFRKGKAPQKLVEEKLGQARIYEELLKDLIPEVYLEAIREQKVKPVAKPRIEVISLEKGKDWQIKATTCELPKVTLGDYQGEIKKALAGEKIWTPGKDKKEPQAEPLKKDQRLAKIFEVLLKTAKLKMPHILLQEEVNRMLARLIDQTGRLGLTVEEYLNSIGKTNETLRKEYEKQAEETLKLELILLEIAEKEEVRVKEAEVENMIAATPDEKARQQLKTPEQKAYLKQLLKKRHVIDSLMKL